MQCTAMNSAAPQSADRDIQCTGVMSPSQGREKGCWMIKEICVWIHQQGVKLWRKESKTTWLTWEPLWSTEMEKRKHYTDLQHSVPWRHQKTPRIKASKLQVSLVTTPRLLLEQLVKRCKRPLKVRWSSWTRQIRTAHANWTSTKNYYHL